MLKVGEVSFNIDELYEVYIKWGHICMVIRLKTVCLYILFLNYYNIKLISRVFSMAYISFVATNRRIYIIIFGWNKYTHILAFYMLLSKALKHPINVHHILSNVTLTNEENLSLYKLLCRES